MARIPLTAKEQLLEARRLGHELSTVRRDFPAGDSTWKVQCTCGYESTWRRSKKAVGSTIIWHLSKVLGESDARESEMLRNGLRMRQNPAS